MLEMAKTQIKHEMRIYYFEMLDIAQNMKKTWNKI